MLRDEYEKMMASFKETLDGKTVNFEELCGESLGFFKMIQEVVQTGSEKEKEEVVAMMGEMYSTLMDETKKLTAKTGLTEQQLLAFAENPENFDADQWKIIQDTRKSMFQAGDSLNEYVKGDKAIGMSGDGESKPALKKKKKRPGGGKKDWMKS